MMVSMCCMYRKRPELFSLITTALFVALNTERVRNVFQLHLLQCKINTTSAHKILLLKAMSNQPRCIENE